MLSIREAKTNDATCLTSLAIRSKAFWGYSSEFMDECQSELLILAHDIASHNNYYAVAEDKNEIRGFYAIKNASNLNIELTALFVEPKYIGSGLGRMLFEHAKYQAKANGASELVLQSDPHAENFYLAMGATLTGKQESVSLPGRYLPTFSIPLP